MKKKQHLQAVDPPTELEAVDRLILSTSAALTEACEMQDFRHIGTLTNTLISLIELKRKINPPTIVELVEMAIEMGCTPDNFLRELHNAWNARNSTQGTEENA